MLQWKLKKWEQGYYENIMYVSLIMHSTMKWFIKHNYAVTICFWEISGQHCPLKWFIWDQATVGHVMPTTLYRINVATGGSHRCNPALKIISGCSLRQQLFNNLENCLSNRKKRQMVSPMSLLFYLYCSVSSELQTEKSIYKIWYWAIKQVVRDIMFETSFSFWAFN